MEEQPYKKNLPEIIRAPDLNTPYEWLLVNSNLKRRGGHLEPEKKLMFAVLEDAVACFQKYVNARDATGKTLFREAKDYILEENSGWIFSFENICEVFELNPNYVRGGLIKWKKRIIKNKKSNTANLDDLVLDGATQEGEVLKKGI